MEPVFGMVLVLSLGLVCEAEDLPLPGLDGLNLLFAQTQIHELEAVLAVGAQFSDQARGGALGRGGRIVQLVSQVAGQLAQGGELLGLLLDAGHLADPVEEHRDHPLGHGGDGLEHLREERFGNEQRPHIGDGKSLAAGSLHARERQQAGYLTGAADEQGHGTAVLAAHMDFAPEDKDHPLGGRALLEENVAGVGDVLLAMAGQP